MSIKFKKGDKVRVISSDLNCSITKRYIGSTGIIKSHDHTPLVIIGDYSIVFCQDELILVDNNEQEASDIKTGLLIAIKQLDLTGTRQDKVLADRLELILKKMES